MVITSASQARANLSKMLDRIAQEKEPVIIERNGTRCAALISIESLVLLERLLGGNIQETAPARGAARIDAHRTERPEHPAAQLAIDSTSGFREDDGLILSEARLQAILDNAPAMIYLKDTEGRFTLINRLFEKTYGVTNQEIAGKSLADIFPDAIVEAYAETDRRVLESGSAAEGELLDPYDDSGRILHVIKFPVKDAAGNLIAIGGIETNITERKHVESALREKERRTQAQNRVLVELAKSKTLAAGNLRGALKEITEASATTLSLGRASVWRYDEDRSRIRCLDLYVADRRQHFDGFELLEKDYPSFFKALENERTIAASNARSDPRTCEFAENYLRPLGITAMLEVPIRIAGEVVGVCCNEQIGGVRHWTPEEHSFVASLGDLVALALEIHGRKLAEEAIRESEERFRDIADVASDWFWELDADLRFSYISDRYLQATGLEAEAVIGKAQEELLRRYVEGPALTIHLADLAAQRRFRDFRFNTVGPSGLIQIWSISGKPVFDERGVFKGYRGTGADVTAEVEIARDQQAAKEAAELANRAKSEFLANMSHELRTPLNAIIGFSDMITSEMAGPIGSARYLEYAADIQESGTHLLNLINDILDLSKIEAGKQELHEEEIELKEVVKSSVRVIKQRADAAYLNLETKVPDYLPLLRADLRAVKQILLNLLSNAVKFTPEGGSITVQADLDFKRRVVLSVKDTGIGMAKEDLEKAMSPFGQVDGSLSRKYEGTGLGLPLTKGLVELHGGSLSIESTLGSGTVVRATFPRERVVTASDAA